MKAKGIDGIYAGITTSDEKTKTYYGLFGYKYTDHNDKIFAKKMDQFLIEEAKSNQEGNIYHMNFKIDGIKNGHKMKFNYAGGTVIYSQVEKNKLHLEDWGEKFKSYKDYMTDTGFSGFIITLQNDKGYDPVNIIFKNKTQQTRIHDLFIKTLFRRKF